ncbi:hypothetical protein [Cohnella soli]|uniref:Uncharacterized protein n=1 Tax=Cohnella soli TaxID=425005 RepID=A0ABW0HLS3_9BACL
MKITRAQRQQLSSLLAFFNLQGGGVFEEEFGFLLKCGMDAQQFITKNRHIRGIKLFPAMDRERERILDTTRYDSYEDFEEAYIRNPLRGLSRLFGEHMDAEKARHLDGVPPEHIYDLHLQHPYKRLMGVAVYIGTSKTA